MIYKKQDRPMCGCGNTQDPNGYCDGSHLNKSVKALLLEGFFTIGMYYSLKSDYLIELKTKCYI